MPAIGRHMPRGLKRCLTTTGVNFGPMHAFHVVPFMGPIVSVMTLHGQENSKKQTSQLSL